MAKLSLYSTEAAAAGVQWSLASRRTPGGGSTVTALRAGHRKTLHYLARYPP